METVMRAIRIVTVASFFILAVAAFAAPSITSLSPTSGTIGTSVTITGSGFGTTQGTSTVKFNGTTATVTSWSSTSIHATVPSGATTGNVAVTVSNVASNGVNFTIVSITSLSPTSGAVGASVTINGGGFGTTQGTSTVTFSSSKIATVTNWSANSITATVPSGAITGNVVVKVGTTTSNGISFMVAATPTMTSLSPTSGAIGTSVTITGTNFGSTQGSSTVKFNGTTATPTSWSATTIKAPVPAGAATGNVVVHSSGVDTNGKPFTVTSGAFTTTGNMLVFHSLFTATLLTNGKVLFTGGQGSSGGNAVADGELYDPVAGAFSATGSLIGARFSHSATLLDDGTVIAVGGAIRDVHGNVVPQSTAELYNPANGTFSPSGSLNTARYAHTATRLNNGVILIVGGSDLNGTNALTSAELYNPATGTFTATGSLNIGRHDHTATLLNNGLVLIAGGSGQGGAALTSAELYNPATGTFLVTGSLANARYDSAAALLNNGSVLIAGGYNGTASLNSAELYNPTSGTFSATGNLTNDRYSHTATLLTNGTVLVAGGFSTTAAVDLASSEIYDPTAGTFSLTSSLNDGRCCHTATLLSGGSVVIAGGNDSTGLTNTAEVYQPSNLTPAGLQSISVTPSNPSILQGTVQSLTATGTFTGNTTQTLASAIWSSSASTVATITNDASNHGQALGIAGGSSTITACAGSICGSTSLNVRTGPPSITSLSQPAAAVGTSITINGSNFGSPQGTSTVTFNGATATPTSWATGSIVVPVPTGATTGPIVVTVGGAASNSLNFIVGTLSSITIAPSAPTVGVNAVEQLSATGTYSEGSTLNLTASATWSSTSTTIATVSTSGLVTGVALGQTTIQAAVGSVSNSVTATVAANPRIAGSLNTARENHTATLLNSGKVLIAGGFGFPFPQNAELYDPGTGAFTAGAVLQNPRYDHSATLLNDGFVLLAGGANSNRAAINTAELYNPSTRNFFFSGNLNRARYNHTATLLPGGKVLIVGGQDQSSNVFASSELYDPSTGTFTFSGNLINARYSHTATLLNNGMVLISGGWGSNNTTPSSSELYDPASGTFSTASSASILGGPFAPVLLNSGKVLIAAGQADELYDPTSGGFTLPRCCTASGNLTATLLNNGTVFTSGGSNNSGVSNVAEIYDQVAGTFTSVGPLNSTRAAHTATRLNDGTVLIVGGIDNGNNVLASAEIYGPKNLTPPSLVSVAITPTNPTMAADTALRLTATGTFSDNSTQVLTSAVWSSSNTSVLTVSNDAGDYGQVFGLQSGSAAVTACTDLLCGSTNVTVGSASPAISGLSPSNGTVGTVVTISGSGFGPTQGSSSVMFNGATATVTSWYPGSIVTTVPANASTGNVVVTVGGVASNGVVFTMPRIIYSLSANTGLPGSSITITGSNFGASTGTVTFNGVAATISSWANTSVVAVVPSTATSGNVVVSNAGVQSNGVPFTVGPIVYSFERSVTLDHTKVANTDQINFPVSISGTFPYLANVANGGNVQNLSGYDIIFTSDAAGNTKLDHEIESYDPVSGTINFWVRIPTLSHSTDTVIYLRYASSVVITSQENRPGVWDSNYQMVLHLGEAAAPYHDSSINAYTSSGGGATYPAQAAGRIGNGQSFNGSTGQYISFSQSQSPNPNAAITMEGWIKTTQNSAAGQDSMFGKVQSYQMLFSSGNTNTSAEGLLYSTDGTTAASLSGAGVINDNNWHHMALTAPANGNIVLYIDGAATASLSNSIPLLGTTANPLQVGASCASCFAMTGTLDEVRISNSVRSADWIATEFNNQNSPAAFSSLGQPNAPSITSLSPFNGEPGTSFTINGSGFTSTQGTVTLSGQPLTISSWSNTSIVVVVPYNTRSGPVVVTAGGVQTNGVTFTVLAPAISGVSPNTGNSGTSVVISGTNFDPSQGNGGVTFGSAPATITSWGANSITAVVPAGAITGNVVVTANDGVASNGVSFTVTDNFAVTSFSPSSGPAGATVTILGGGFGASQGTSTVAFDGATAAVSSWSDTQIVATVPQQTGTGPISVTVNSNTTQSTASFILSATVQIADSFGRTSSYTATSTGGTWQAITATGSGCSSCTTRGNIQRSFGSSGNMTSYTDELGHVTTYTYDANGNMTSISKQLDSNNTVTTSYTYNSFGEVLTMTDPLGNVTTNAYDANGNLLTVTTPVPQSGVAASVTQFAYDVKGQLTQITDPLNHVSTLTYTPAGLISTITDAQQHVTTYQYDSHGNRTAITDALQHTTSFAYDAMDRLTTITYPDTTTVSFGYDYRGRRMSVTDQNGKVTTYTYDDADRLTSVTDAANHVTQYSYDTENNLLTITDAAGHSTSFTYDAFGRVTQTSFPSALTESYTYDAVGNLTNKDDRKGQSILYVYDALNRLSHKGYPDSTGVDYVYDLAGKIRQVTDPTGTYGFAYDNMGRLIGTTTQYTFLPGATFSNSYGYDGASNRTSFTPPDGSTNTYQYDPLNRLATLTSSLAGQFTFSYDGLSRRTGLNRPNGVNTTYGYDSLSRLLNVLHKAGTTTLDGAGYTYDNAGNRTSKTNNLNNITEQYTYDAIYQLTQVVQGTTTTESYTYDAVGNRLSSLGMASYTYNASNELTATSAATYTYDANGNTLTKADSTGTTTYNWDFENRLSSVVLPSGTVTFKYDPFGRRIQKASMQGAINSITNYLYDGADTVEELDSGGNLLARYMQGPRIDDPLAERRSGTNAFYEQDGVGSATSLSSLTGTILNSYTYDTFGNSTLNESFVNPYRYTARDYDSETGLQYSRARYFDSQTGRFLSEDPLAFDAGIDFYIYVGNNPVDSADPLGMFATSDDKKPWDYRGIIADLLRGSSKCADWFRKGKCSAVDVINNIPILFETLKDQSIGGETGHDPTSPIRINTNGMFYSESPFAVGHEGPMRDPVYYSGTFGARMVILMHELAHKIGLPNEEFPDDALGPGSEQNTLKIIQLCRDAIKDIARKWNEKYSEIPK
jgi:RHS repeat-associated protein